ncbi:MAG: hypothetical protein KDJ28_19240, partial [Candidatus Competibacteraceae bacterium]|nr:hypothetical protein [Candidatus Competibacteraceae bacterium]
HLTLFHRQCHTRPLDALPLGHPRNLSRSDAGTQADVVGAVWGLMKPLRPAGRMEQPPQSEAP